MLYVGAGETNLGSVDRLEYEYLTVMLYVGGGETNRSSVDRVV